MGFCHGVQKAFDTVNELSAEFASKTANGNDDGNGLLILGDLVHNKEVVTAVERAGLTTVYDTAGVTGRTVVIRTHGEQKERIEELASAGNVLVDCTCIIVKKVREKALALEQRHPAVVICGKRKHPEIVGLVSWLSNPHVVLSAEDIAALPNYKSVGIVSQTTIASEQYEECIRLLEEKYGKWNPEAGTGAEWLQTICAHTKRNQEASVETAGMVDLMIVVGAKHSSNSNKLFEKCKAANPNTIFVQGLADIDLSRLTPDSVVGISSGASTPDWIVDEIVQALESLQPVSA
jgi:4-hydroxy-3-methylbut-2-enyl diphosphate reductase